MSSQESQLTTSTEDSDTTWYPSDLESDTEPEYTPDTDTFNNTQNDFKLIGELLK